MQLDRITDWLWCLRTPVVNAYAVRERDGFNLIDASTAAEERAILELLAELAGQAPSRVRVYEILLTHGHDDHTGSAAALAELTGARLVAPRDEAAVISRERAAAPPVLAGWEVPLFEEVTPKVPQAPPVVPDRLVEDADRLGWQHDAGVVALPGTRAVTSRCGSRATACSWPATRWPATTDGRWSACSTQTRQAPPRARSTWRRSTSTWPASAMASRCPHRT
jgi:hypothetical protein